MNTWPAHEEVCFGVCCPIHGTCARYAAADFNTNQDQIRIDTCGPEHSSYIALIPAITQKTEEVPA